ncbi:MAG: hypothetical protein ACTHM9_15860 [Gemmatimonadales bacterium]|jgi:hypothetical protein
MSVEPLAAYLNDHLTASIAALRLMDALADRAEPELGGILRSVAREVREDQQLLREVLDRIRAGERRLAQAAALVSEKMSEGRLALAARSHPALATLEGLESIALGLQGKLGLFRVLEEVAPHDPRLAGLPFAARAARTEAQHATIESERRAAAREAFDGAMPGVAR